MQENPLSARTADSTLSRDLPKPEMIFNGRSSVGADN